MPGAGPSWSYVPAIERLEDRTVPTTSTASDMASLIGDIHTANASSQAVTISMTKGTYDLTAVDNTTNGGNGLPVITAKSLTIEGNGSTIQRDTSSKTPSFRIFDLGKGAIVTLQDLTITGGQAAGVKGTNGLIGVFGGIGASIDTQYDEDGATTTDSDDATVSPARALAGLRASLPTMGPPVREAAFTRLERH